MDWYEITAVAITLLILVWGSWSIGKRIPRKLGEAFLEIANAIEDDKVTKEELKRILEKFRKVVITVQQLKTSKRIPAPILGFFDWLLSLFIPGRERPSRADIVPRQSMAITTNPVGVRLNFAKLNIPFTKPPGRVWIPSIPDTNSMDSYYDYGNNNLLIKPADEENHKIMCDWIAQQWKDSGGKLDVDCVYRIMVNEEDDPYDFSKPHRWYCIHRLIRIGFDNKGRYFIFKGTNNPKPDPYQVRDKNLLYLSVGVIY